MGMAIRILDSPEPLSFASESQTCILAESEASRILTKEMQLYCERWSTGRSFLISGHRGSGKTTLVHNAFLQVAKDKRPPGNTWLRPLLIPLHGLNLLAAASRAAVEAKLSSSDPEKTDGKTLETDAGGKPTHAVPDAEAQAALIQITLSIYQALTGEMSRQLRRRLYERPVTLQQREQLEMAAQLEIEMFECPEPARFRDYWRRVGCLEKGVLFPVGPRQASVPDQGLRELVALSSACEAFRRISGEYKRTDTSKASEDTKTTISLNGSAKDLLGSLIALFTGGLVGTGSLVSKADPATATFAGVAAAFGAAALLKYSGSHTRDRSGSRESTFLFDFSVATLDRVLPTLIERIRRAGLAPVFVVDELDKVPDLQQRIHALVNHLKKFVSETAFFCFLTDRSYYEVWKQLGRQAAYPVQYTYFSHDLYVVFSARDLHSYLNRVLEAPSSPTFRPSQLADAPAGERARHQIELSDAERAIADEVRDYPLYPYVLLHRSRMHPIDLRRELAMLRDQNNNLDLPAGRIRSSPTFRIDLILQIAVEMVLDDEELAEELSCDPTSLRLAHDALYHLSREWQSNRDPDLRDEARPRFAAELAARMGQEARNADNQPIQLAEEEVTLLFRAVRRVADLVSDLKKSYPAALEKWKEKRAKRKEPFAPEVERALGLAYGPEPVLDRVDGERWLYRWRINAPGVNPGNAADPSDPQESPVDPPDIWENVVFVEELDRAIESLGGGGGPTARLDLTTLSSQLGILSTTPAWSAAQAAIGRLKTARMEKRGYDEFADDVRCVGDFANMARRHHATLARALFCGAILGKASGQKEPGERLLLGLRAISSRYDLLKRQESEIAQHLEALELSLRNEHQLTSSWSIAPLTTEESVVPWKQGVRKELDSVALLDIFLIRNLQNRRKAAWEEWDSRLSGIRVEGALPGLDELICAAATVSPASLLPQDPETMRLAGWSEILLRSLADVSPETPSHAPLWMLCPALLRLGFPAGCWQPILTALKNGSLRYIHRPVREELHRAEQWALRGGPAEAKPALFILRKPQGSALESWTASSQGAAIVLAMDEAQAIASPALLSLVDRIAIEIGAGEGAGTLHKDLLKVAKPQRRQPLPPRDFHAQPPTSFDTYPVACSLDELLALHRAEVEKGPPG